MPELSLKGKDFITCEDWTREELDVLLKTAKNLKKMFRNGTPHRLLQDQTVFNIFFEQSTRTRNSMGAGITQLGGHAHDLTPDKIQLQHGESTKDTAGVLSRMGDAIACRNCFYGIGNKYLNELARWASVPVFNLQCDVYHPMQAVADLMTLQERSGESLKGLKVAISWAYAASHAKPLSVPHSQILLFARYGMEVTVAAPKEFPLQSAVVEKARAHAEENECTLAFTDDMDAAFEGAQVVIPKNWGGFAFFDDFQEDDEQLEEMRANLEKHRDWRCDARRMALADPDAVFMHAMPVDRGREADDEVVDGPASLIIEEAENRLHTAKTVMALTMRQRGWE